MRPTLIMRINIRYILLNKNNIIIRLSKVIEKSFPLFNNWINQIKCNQTISPFNNIYFSPVHITYVCKIILDIINEKDNGGIWQVSSKEPINYYTAIKYIAEKLHLNQSLILPKESAKLGSQNNIYHMDSLRLEKTFNISPPNYTDTLNDFLQYEK